MPASVHRVAFRYLIARQWSDTEVQKIFRDWAAARSKFYEWLRDSPNIAIYAWADLVNAGRRLAEWVIETRSIPKSKIKATELAVRLFSTVTRTQDLPKWVEKNERHIDLLTEAMLWPERMEGGKEVSTLAGFRIHNTVGLEGDKLRTTLDVIERAAAVIQASGIPNARGILYGDLYIVGQLRQSRTLAWYSQQTDEVYLRPHLKVGRGELHNLVHELGHRHWFREIPRNIRDEWSRHHWRTSFNRGRVKLPQPGEELPLKIRGLKEPHVVEKIDFKSIHFVGGGSVSRDAVQRILDQEAAFPTPYAAKEDTEHYAEAFAMYALGTLQPDHKEAFKRIIIEGKPAVVKG